ncbi:thiamine phosphate synthase [Peribacillus glennii]|uniref:Thiamine-phosphate synthase n=1 Tax=Peribacillus glennii TaxID=2303991 RepID=A0A372LFZ0_9BACI|nr:thiamine phosphate synthase [Peribacillus glennii]RFU65223.1 thiamine phosphate synthase [Peribacillus glennii]
MGRINSEELRDLLKVYFIMGSTNTAKNPEEVLKEAINGGITLFQFREKGEGALKGDEKYALARQLQKICRASSIPFIVNDDLELAMEIDADGLHIGQEDEPAERVREKIGDKILGVSIHTIDEAEAAIRAGADYFGLGPIFPTNTKTDTTPVQGTSLIQVFRKRGITVPIVGIGGITAQNAGTVMKAGADGVSVITAISQAISVTDAARELRKNV